MKILNPAEFLFLSKKGGSGGGGTPGGLTTQIQFNDGGSFGADSGLTYDKINQILAANAFNITGARVRFLTASDNIQSAINAATAGDTLILGSGTYNISSSLTINKKLSLIGQGDLITIINTTADNVTAITVTANDVVIDGIGFESTASDPSNAVTVDGTSGTTITRFLIQNFRVKYTNSVDPSGGFNFLDAGGVVRDGSIDVTGFLTSTEQMRCIFKRIQSTCELDTTLDVINVKAFGTATGDSGSAILRGFMNWNNDADSSPQASTMNVINCVVKLSGDAIIQTEAIQLEGSTGGQVTSNLYNCVIDGGNTAPGSLNNDIRVDVGTIINMYETVLVNALVSSGGTINRLGQAQLSAIRGSQLSNPTDQTTVGKSGVGNLIMTAQNGGNCSSTGSRVGGVGGACADLIGGKGGSANLANTASTGGVGGPFKVVCGAGGDSTVATGTNTGGKGGNIELTAGAGGAASGGSVNNAGAGGDAYIAGGLDGSGLATLGGAVYLGKMSGGSVPGNVYIQGKTSGEVVINDDGRDCNFRIESDTNANYFFLKGSSAPRFGIGGAGNPGATLNIGSDGSAIVMSDATPPFLLVRSVNSVTGMELQNPNTGTGAEIRIMLMDSNNDMLSLNCPGSAATGTAFGLTKSTFKSITTTTSGGSGVGLVIGTSQANFLLFGTNNVERARFLSTGELGIGTITPKSLLHVNGSFSGKVTSVNDVNYTVLQTDYIIEYTALSAGRTVTLPTVAASGAGKIIIIKDGAGAAGTNNITVDGNGAELIDGSANVVINTNYGYVALYCNGSKWLTIGKA